MSEAVIHVSGASVKCRILALAGRPLSPLFSRRVSSSNFASLQVFRFVKTPRLKAISKAVCAAKLRVGFLSRNATMTLVSIAIVILHAARLQPASNAFSAGPDLRIADPSVLSERALGAEGRTRNPFPSLSKSRRSPARTQRRDIYNFLAGKGAITRDVVSAAIADEECRNSGDTCPYACCRLAGA